MSKGSGRALDGVTERARGERCSGPGTSTGLLGALPPLARCTVGAEGVPDNPSRRGPFRACSAARWRLGHRILSGPLTAPHRCREYGHRRHGSAPMPASRSPPPRSPDVNRRRTALLSLTALMAAGLTAVPVAPAGADEVEQIRNGTFDTTTDGWWSDNVTLGLSDGRVCADVPGGTVNRWDAGVGQNDLTLVKGRPTGSASARRARPRATRSVPSWASRSRRTTPTTRSHRN